MRELLDSFSQTPILLLGRKEQKGGHLEERNSHVKQMGRGRKGILCQSRKKTKTPKGRLNTQHTLFIAEPDNGEVIDPPIQISEQLLTTMKKMSPQDLKNSLITQQEEEEEVEICELTDLEEFDLTGPGEPVYETPIMTSQLCGRIMSNEFSEAQVEYILKKSLGF